MNTPSNYWNQCWLRHQTARNMSECDWNIWVRSRNCGCLVTCFCYQLIAKPGIKTAAVSWPDPYERFESWSITENLPSWNDHHFVRGLNHSTLLVLKLEYSGTNMSIPWLLIPWRLAVSSIQQPWYEMRKINGSLSLMRKDLNNLHHISTVKCRYNAVKYNMILHTSLQWCTEAENKSLFGPTKYIPYLALAGKLWDVFCKNLGENWPHYNSTAV